MKRKRKTSQAKQLRRTNDAPLRLPFIEHFLELRRRLFYVVVSILVWSSAAYAIEHKIVNILLEPAHGEKFIYTSVGGGLDFLFRVCLYVGIVLSLPVIIYQSLRYLQPLIGMHSTRFILLGSLASGVLAVGGVLFGYFLGLPAALEFLLNQFHTKDISALITIQSYLHFVIVYLVGSSLMFQVPLVIFFINKFKRIPIKLLLKYERWVIVVSIIAAAAINPSPRVADLALLAVPMILSYQVGVLLVWLVNRKTQRPAYVRQLLEKDSEIQRERNERIKTVQYIWQQSDLAISLAPMPDLKPTPLPTPRHHVAKPTVKPAAAIAVPVVQAHEAKAVPVATSVKTTHHSAAAAAVPTSGPQRSQKYVNDFIDFRTSRRTRPVV
jgi:sec-independent protein translocase protein TatC